MAYKIHGSPVSNEELKEYLSRSINRVFAILGIYEECTRKNDFEDYLIYLNRIITEFDGIYDLLGISDFLSLTGVLKGMENLDRMEHKKVKSLTFYCISVIKKVRVV